MCLSQQQQHHELCIHALIASAGLHHEAHSHLFLVTLRDVTGGHGAGGQSLAAGQRVERVRTSLSLSLNACRVINAVFAQHACRLLLLCLRGAFTQTASQSISVHVKPVKLSDWSPMT